MEVGERVLLRSNIIAVLSGSPSMFVEVWSWGQLHGMPWCWDEEDADGMTPLHVAALADRGLGIVNSVLQRCPVAREAWITPSRGKRFSPAQVRP